MAATASASHARMSTTPPGGRARCEAPPGVDAEIRPCENEDRVHVAQHVEGEVDARGDLEGAEAVAGRGGQPPGEKEPSANLEKEERHHQRLRMSLRYTWRKTFITALYVPSPAGNVRWLAMWSVRKIMTRASADTP